MAEGHAGLTPASAALAFGAGVVSLLSPCVLALVPAYVGYLSADALGRPGRSRVLARGLLFVLGFSTVFVLLGASATALGQLFWFNQPLMRRVGGLLVILLGLHQLGVVRLGALERELRAVGHLGTLRRGWMEAPWGAFAVGLAFAAGWSPCVGPVLASILLLAGTADTVTAGVGLLALYAAGMALPFLAMASLLQRGSGRLPRLLVRHSVWAQRTSGALMIAMGVMLYTNFFLRLPGYLNYYQWLGL